MKFVEFKYDRESYDIILVQVLNVMHLAYKGAETEEEKREVMMAHGTIFACLSPDARQAALQQALERNWNKGKRKK